MLPSARFVVGFQHPNLAGCFALEAVVLLPSAEGL